MTTYRACRFRLRAPVDGLAEFERSVANAAIAGEPRQQAIENDGRLWLLSLSETSSALSVELAVHGSSLFPLLTSHSLRERGERFAFANFNVHGSSSLLRNRVQAGESPLLHSELTHFACRKGDSRSCGQGRVALFGEDVVMVHWTALLSRYPTSNAGRLAVPRYPSNLSTIRNRLAGLRFDAGRWT